MPTITPTRVSRLRHAPGHVDLAFVAVIAAALAATGLLIVIGPIDVLAAARTVRCA
jgi:hypothetical protein